MFVCGGFVIRDLFRHQHELTKSPLFGCHVTVAYRVQTVQSSVGFTAHFTGLYLKISSTMALVCIEWIRKAFNKIVFLWFPLVKHIYKIH